MDDPQPILFDPQHDDSALNNAGKDGAVRPVSYDEPPAQPPQPPQPPVGGDQIPAPRTPVTAIPVPQAGYIILSGVNAEDVELVRKALEAILVSDSQDQP